MGSLVKFAANGHTYQGYHANPAEPGPPVIVIQEWWGLVGHIKSVADRFAQAGFNALAPDFYDGRSTNEPDEAGSLMMALDVPNAALVIKGAVEYLSTHPSSTSDQTGVVGFCMGGQLALFAAGVDQRIRACVNFYGIHPNVSPDFAAFNCPVLGMFAEHDDYATAEAIEQLDRDLTAAGVTHVFHHYAGTNHAFFNSDRPQVFNRTAAEDSWAKTIAFFRENLS